MSGNYFQGNNPIIKSSPDNPEVVEVVAPSDVYISGKFVFTANTANSDVTDAPGIYVSSVDGQTSTGVDLVFGPVPAQVGQTAGFYMPTAYFTGTQPSFPSPFTTPSSINGYVYKFPFSVGAETLWSDMYTASTIPILIGPTPDPAVGYYSGAGGIGISDTDNNRGIQIGGWNHRWDAPPNPKAGPNPSAISVASFSYFPLAAPFGPVSVTRDLSNATSLGGGSHWNNEQAWYYKGDDHFINATDFPGVPRQYSNDSGYDPVNYPYRIAALSPTSKVFYGFPFSSYTPVTTYAYTFPFSGVFRNHHTSESHAFISGGYSFIETANTVTDGHIGSIEKFNLALMGIDSASIGKLSAPPENNVAAAAELSTRDNAYLYGGWNYEQTILFGETGSDWYSANNGAIAVMQKFPFAANETPVTAVGELFGSTYNGEEQGAGRGFPSVDGGFVTRQNDGILKFPFAVEDAYTFHIPSTTYPFQVTPFGRMTGWGY